MPDHAQRTINLINAALDFVDKFNTVEGYDLSNIDQLYLNELRQCAVKYRESKKPKPRGPDDTDDFIPSW
jgi:hypothetical protein